MEIKIHMSECSVSCNIHDFNPLSIKINVMSVSLFFWVSNAMTIVLRESYMNR